MTQPFEQTSTFAGDQESQIGLFVRLWLLLPLLPFTSPPSPLPSVEQVNRKDQILSINYWGRKTFALDCNTYALIVD